ncbi:MAG: hypothetical protein CMA63_05755 [Euryarchaeota archaeon]|nr:hypothetical protein [Euryarchaeota archaeon]
MSVGDHPKDATVVFAQVGSAKANHRVETQSNLLRPKAYALPSRVVYLGDVATTLLAHLKHPDTPHFTTPPQFNEQKWTLRTESGGLEISVESEAYWGFGLLNSGYLNKIVLTGQRQSQARLLFDLTASLGHRPWEFKHGRSAERYFDRYGAGHSSRSNELVWKEFIAIARAEFQEALFAMEQRGVEVKRRVKTADSSESWNKAHAEQLLITAAYDLDVAKGALADENAPGMERALARAEAAFIEADPGGEVNLKPTRNEAEREHVLSMSASEEEVTFVDLVSENE